MMIGIGDPTRRNPTVRIPSWDNSQDDPTAIISSPISPSPYLESLTSLLRYLPSNESDGDTSHADSFSCDEFRMYEFKVRRCARVRSHDWTECPFAHPGEKARRRDPRKFHYSGTACPEFRKGSCRKGDSCEFSHGVFECWLHPARYRTQPCKDGMNCRRRVCFFAHAPEQLRVLPDSLRQRFDVSHIEKPTFGSFVSSPTSILISPPVSPPADSPPMSPSFNSPNELAVSMRKMQIGSGFRSPGCSILRSEFCNTPTTPTRTPTRSGLGQFDFWDGAYEEEPVMERVESGKEIRAKMYARLSKENSLGRVNSSESGADVAWISELVN